jgi:hypothetical protein
LAAIGRVGRRWWTVVVFFRPFAGVGSATTGSIPIIAATGRIVVALGVSYARRQQQGRRAGNRQDGEKAAA